MKLEPFILCNDFFSNEKTLIFLRLISVSQYNALVDAINTFEETLISERHAFSDYFSNQVQI
jgi:hypothetical protein